MRLCKGTDLSRAVDATVCHRDMPANPLLARNYALSLAARKVRAFLVWEVGGRNAEDSPIRIAMLILPATRPPIP